MAQEPLDELETPRLPAETREGDIARADRAAALHTAGRGRIGMWSHRLGLGAGLMVIAVCSTGTPCGAEELQHPITSLSCAPSTLTCEELVALGYAYPYAREPGSYLFINGAAYPYVELSNDLLAHGSVRVGSTVVTTMKLLQTLGLADRITRRRTPVIGYGSNATVSALTRKYVAPSVTEPAVIPVTRARLRDYDVVWSPHLVFNGAMPATIVRSRGTVVEVWITWLDDLELKRMHDSEGVGTLYSYGTLSPSRLVSEVHLSEPPHVYVDCFGALALDGVVQAVGRVPAKRRRFSAVDSEQAMQGVAPYIGWTDSVFALLLDNVQSPARRAERTQTLAALGRFIDDPGYHAECPCGAASCPVP